MSFGVQWRLVEVSFCSTWLLGAAMGLTGCEMFFGDFVQRPAPTSGQDDTECVASLKCRNGNVSRCSLENGEYEWTTEQECGAAGCNSATVMCNVCAPNTLQCVGEQLQQCEADGSGWRDQELCSNDTPKCDVTTGRCEPCLVSDSKCKEGDAHTLLECRPMGDMPRAWVETSCASLACLENGGEAYCETCTEVGRKGCVENPSGPSNTVRECTAERRWINVPCSPGAVCMGDACVFNP